MYPSSRGRMSNVSMALLKVGESNLCSASRIAGSSGPSVASLGDLALHTAQRLQHTGRAAAQEDRVVGHVEHSESHRLSRAPSLTPLTTLVGSSPSNTR